MSQYTEKGYFTNLVRLFEQQISLREAIKGETDRAKENEFDYKVIKKLQSFMLTITLKKLAVSLP